MDESQQIRTSTADGIFTLTIDHPPLNALGPQTLVELESAVERFLADPGCRVAVIASANRAIFLSGADLPVFASMTGPGELAQFVRRGQALFQRIHASPKPFIAAINGLALGGGLELALACHLRVAYEHAKLGLPEITLGIIPGWGGTQLLPRLVGAARAAEMILLGETITAQEALRLGLVNQLAAREAVQPAALELAQKIAAKRPQAISAALIALTAAGDLDLAGGLACEAAQMAELTQSEETRQHILAMLARRRAPGA